MFADNQNINKTQSVSSGLTLSESHSTGGPARVGQDCPASSQSAAYEQPGRQEGRGEGGGTPGRGELDWTGLCGRWGQGGPDHITTITSNISWLASPPKHLNPMNVM